MPAALSDDQALAALQFAMSGSGHDLVQWNDWRNTDRPGPFGPIHGILVHHTGSDLDPGSSGISYTRSILRPGYAGLPGPLCSVGGAPNGDLILLSNQDANHAGMGDASVLQRVINNDAPLDSELRPRFNTVDGNARFHGIEVMFLTSMTAAQYDTAIRYCAGMCRAYGWGGGSVIAHREWQLGKPDPHNTPMGKLRRDVNARLAAWKKGTGSSINPSPGIGAGGGGGTPTPTTPPVKEGDDMPKQTPWRSNPDDQTIDARTWKTIRCDKGGSVSIVNEEQDALIAESDASLVFTGLTATSVVQLRTYITDNKGKRLSSGYGQEYRGVARTKLLTLDDLGAKNRRVYLEVWASNACTVTQVGARAIYWN